jgi:hypothetical protein
MTEEQHEDWNPLAASVLKDQRQAYDQMREKCPVAHSKFLDWSLFRHADIAAVLDDPATFINMARFPAIPNGLNPPVHGPWNAAVGAFFGAEQMTLMEPRARQISSQLLAPLCANDEVEFIADFTTPYAMKTQCALLGWPEQQWQSLADWVHGNYQVALSGDAVAGKELAERFAAQVKSNLDLHRAAPHAAADATDGLLQTEVNGKRCSDEEITSILRNWVAGHGTTVDALGIVLLHLARHAALQQRLRQTPALVPAAIEEILRVDGPLVANRRTTTREVTIQGRVIPKDASLSLMWIAANRDPAAFTDADAVKLERGTDAGMVWGRGIHFCLGAPLARLEMRVALEELLARTTLFELAGAVPPRKVYPGNGVSELLLRLR